MKIKLIDLTPRPHCRFCDAPNAAPNGRNNSGTRKYMCRVCRRQFVKCPEKPGLYSEAVKRDAVHRVVRLGESWKQVAYEVGCDLRTIRKWIEATDARCACGRKLTHVGICRQKYAEVAA